MKLNWTERITLTQSGVKRIKAIAGVYRLIYYNRTTEKYYVYYVGQADDLNDRLWQHLPGNEENTCCQRHLNNYTCYFRAAAASRQADRDGAEVALYNHFEPSCVERIPDVEPIDINFD
jgi:excinuclease UvrABC nuclease subunit